MTPTRAEVLRQIDTVPEPCGLLMRAPLSILEMGLVDEVRIDGGRVEVEIVLTDATCVHLSAMRRYLTDAIGELDGIESVDIVPSTTKLWTPDRLQPKPEDTDD